MFIDGDTSNPSETLTADQLTSLLLSCSPSFSSSNSRAVTFPPTIHFRTRIALPSTGRPSPCRLFIAVTVTVPTIDITQNPRKGSKPERFGGAITRSLGGHRAGHYTPPDETRGRKESRRVFSWRRKVRKRARHRTRVKVLPRMLSVKSFIAQKRGV